jgi:hypothetical protein
MIVSLVLVVLAAPALAQNRLAVEAGGLFPFSSFGDVNDTSPYFGATFDIQDVNPLGQVALLGVFLRAAYSPLVVNKNLKALLESNGRETGSSYFEGTLGLKAHSKASPFFLSVDAGYANYNLPGGGSKSGFASGVGLGTAFGGPAVHLTIEGRMNVAFMSGIDNLQFFTLTAGLGFPF